MRSSRRRARPTSCAHTGVRGTPDRVPPVGPRSRRCCRNATGQCMGSVDGARHPIRSPNAAGRPLAVAGRSAPRSSRPPARRLRPTRAREVVKRHHGRESWVAGGADHPPVVIRVATVKLAVPGSTRAHSTENVCVETEFRRGAHVVGVAVVMVAGIARRLCTADVGSCSHAHSRCSSAALDLMSGRCRAPDESSGRS